MATTDQGTLNAQGLNSSSWAGDNGPAPTQGTSAPSNLPIAVTSPVGYTQVGDGIYKKSDTLTSTPINNQPSANNLESVPSVSVPSPYYNGSDASNSAISKTQAAVNSFATDTQNQANVAATNLENSQNSAAGAMNTYLGKGQAQLNAEQVAGIPAKQAAASKLQNLYTTSQINLNDQLNTILQNPGLTAGQRQAAIQATTQQSAYNIANVGIAASMAQNDYAVAQQLVNHQIDVKYAPLKDAADFYQNMAQTNASLFTSTQANALNAKSLSLTQQYNQAVYTDHLLSDTKVQMIKDAAANGAPDDVKEAIWNSPDIGSAAAAGGKYTANGNYTPVQTGYDDNTGLPIYSGFNQKTGNLEVKNPKNLLGQTGSEQTTVTGGDGTAYQMGASSTMGAYASATSTQVANITASIAKIKNSVGNITDNVSAQTAINSVAPKSPITGDMVMSAANKYGVDPAAIIGVMQAETQCGTDGSKGSRECNFGNVGNTDSLMAAGKSIAMKPQQGVDAVAKNLAMRKVQAGQNDPAQPTSTSGLTPQQVAGQTVKNAPMFLQPAMVTSASTGGVFIDSSKLPKGMDVVAQSYSSSHNIPILNPDQVAIVNGIDEAIRNVTDVIAPAWNKIAPQGTLGKIGLQTSSIYGNLLDTNKNADVKTFQQNRENVAQQVKALSGSSPRLGLIGLAEAALPDLSGYGFHYGTGSLDSAKVGNAKLQRTLDLLNQGMKTYLPNAQPVALPQIQQAPATAYTVNGVTYEVRPDGQYYPKQ